MTTKHVNLLPIGGGEMGERIRSFDWSSTRLGPIKKWPDNLRFLVDQLVNTPVAQVLMWGREGTMIYNDGYREIAGANHPEALGKLVSEIWPEIWDWNRERLRSGFEGEAQSFLEQPMMLERDGTPELFYFDLYYTPVRGVSGEIAGVLCTVVDNTGKHLAQQGLRESKADIVSMTDAVPLLIGFIDRDLIYRFGNSACQEWFGIDNSAIIGKHVRDVIGNEAFQRHSANLAKALSGEPLVVDMVIRRADAEERAVEIRYTPRRALNGKVDGVFVVLVDMDERKRSEIALEISNSRFRAAVDAVHGVLWTNNADGKMTGPQPSWAALTGQSYNEYQGDGWLDAVHPEDQESTATSWKNAVADAEPYIFEHRVRRFDGFWRTFQIRAVPIRNAAGAVVEWVGVHTDITDHRRAQIEVMEKAEQLERQVRHRERAEEQLRQLNETLEARVIEEIAVRRQAEVALVQAQKMESIGKLTGGIAHDFNNLLQVVSGNLHLLAKDVVGNERAEQRVINALAGVNRGAKLASQLLAFGRRQALEPKVVNIGRFVTGMDDLLRSSLGEAVEIETIISGGLWNTFIDPNQVENALLNLAINARDAMNGTGKLTIEVGNASLDDAYARSHAEVEPGQYVMLAVSDTGEGMTPDVLEQVFEPFFTTKPENKGTGLGLSMVYGFVKQSNGHVKIYSEPGYGTTVKLYLPRALEAEDVEVRTERGPVQGGTETVLVVEDDDEVRATVVELLTDLGYSVLKAVDAQSALNVIDSGMPIDLLFTDVVMPGTLKSPELARKARERLPNVAVLFTSGYTENSIVHGGRLDAGVELLSKPYSRDALARKVRHVLANQGQREQMQAPEKTASENKPAPEIAQSQVPVGQTKGVTILLVEDDAMIRMNTSDMLQDLGYVVIEAGNAEDAISALQATGVQVLVTDLGLPGMSGAALARKARELRPAVGLIFATGRDTVPEGSPEDVYLLPKPYGEDDLQRAIEAVWHARAVSEKAEEQTDKV
ncbi:hybrid sensor histidine kinase/response regulator [Limoniibacter endophyticus]|uniref:histidine kinase n=1 Tax=Limoniibacter endophyticus TaxID=1565040 RepID=A0A8J3GJJ6_9HYPH|nr:PAS domain-containing protein [Limoniibacter endophyticus]GHC78508.1 two-component system sensor histidine kinase/response regulator [Limoniibacter endophyticus]